VGLVADKTPELLKTSHFGIPSADLGLRAGFMLAVLFPAAMIFFVRYLTKKKQ